MSALLVLALATLWGLPPVAEALAAGTRGGKARRGAGDLEAAAAAAPAQLSAGARWLLPPGEVLPTLRGANPTAGEWGRGGERDVPPPLGCELPLRCRKARRALIAGVQPPPWR